MYIDNTPPYSVYSIWYCIFVFLPIVVCESWIGQTLIRMYIRCGMYYMPPKAGFLFSKAVRQIKSSCHPPTAVMHNYIQCWNRVPRVHPLWAYRDGISCYLMRKRQSGGYSWSHSLMLVAWDLQMTQASLQSIHAWYNINIGFIRHGGLFMNCS